MQVYKLAQEIGVSSQVILKTLQAWGTKVPGNFNSIDDPLVQELRAAFVDHNAPKDPDKPRKPSTKPWEDKSWTPDVFRLDKKHNGFSCRFIDKLNVEKRIDEGWQVANIKDYIDTDKLNQHQRDEERGVSETSLTRKGMVLMELPDHLMDKKQAWLKHKADRQSLVAQKRDFLARGKRISQQLGASKNLVTDDIEQE